MNRVCTCLYICILWQNINTIIKDTMGWYFHDTTPLQSVREYECVVYIFN